MCSIFETNPLSVIPMLGMMAHNLPREASKFRMPKVDVIKHSDNYEFLFDLPGVAKEAVSIEVSPDRVLHLQAEVAQPEDTKWLLQERCPHRFERKLRLPKDAEREGIAASLEDGVLHLRVARSESVPVTVRLE